MNRSEERGGNCVPKGSSIACQWARLGPVAVRSELSAQPCARPCAARLSRWLLYLCRRQQAYLQRHCARGTAQCSARPRASPPLPTVGCPAPPMRPARAALCISRRTYVPAPLARPSRLCFRSTAACANERERGTAARRARAQAHRLYSRALHSLARRGLLVLTRLVLFGALFCM